MSAPQIGTGTTVTFSGASGFVAQPLSINLEGQSRPAIDTTYLGTSTARTFVKGELYDAGTLRLGLAFDPTETSPIAAGATGTVVITYMALGVWTASGIATDLSITNTLEERIEAEPTIKLTGAQAVS